MNPNAREFVPAHILRKRQEEANSVNQLTDQLDRVGIEETNRGSENGTSSNHASSKIDSNSCSEKPAGEKSSDLNEQDCERIHNSSSETKANNSSNNNTDDTVTNHVESGRNFNDTEDDGYLLRAGENLCEFNGEQFIIPGDDEEEAPAETGYDFGNDEDNDNEDVCNAFEEFLENLPDQ